MRKGSQNKEVWIESKVAGYKVKLSRDQEKSWRTDDKKIEVWFLTRSRKKREVRKSNEKKFSILRDHERWKGLQDATQDKGHGWRDPYLERLFSNIGFSEIVEQCPQSWEMIWYIDFYTQPNYLKCERRLDNNAQGLETSLPATRLVEVTGR